MGNFGYASIKGKMSYTLWSVIYILAIIHTRFFSREDYIIIIIIIIIGYSAKKYWMVNLWIFLLLQICRKWCWYPTKRCPTLLSSSWCSWHCCRKWSWKNGRLFETTDSNARERINLFEIQNWNKSYFASWLYQC